MGNGEWGVGNNFLVPHSPLPTPHSPLPLFHEVQAVRHC